MSMIDFDGTLIDANTIATAAIENRFYMNGSSHHLVVTTHDGQRYSREHGWGFDAFKTLDIIKLARGVIR